jgi:Clp amino terminal domain, pathogenicity island component
MAKATTVRFTDEIYQRLDQASARTGLPVNSIVIAACLEWMQRHAPGATVDLPVAPWMATAGPISVTAPRWSTLKRAVKVGMAESTGPGPYPFDRFSGHAKALLALAQQEAEKAGFSYIGTEHLLLACFAKPEFHSAQVLVALGVDEGAVRTAITTAIGRAPARTIGGIIPTTRVKKVIEISFQICGAMRHPHVGTDHILLALAAEGKGIAAQVLKDVGATPQRIEAEVGLLAEPEA